MAGSSSTSRTVVTSAMLGDDTPPPPSSQGWRRYQDVTTSGAATPPPAHTKNTFRRRYRGKPRAREARSQAEGTENHEMVTERRLRLRGGSSPAPGTSSAPPSTWPPGSWTRLNPAVSAWTSPLLWPSSARRRRHGTGWGSAMRWWPRGWGRSCPGRWSGPRRPAPESEPSFRYHLVIFCPLAREGVIRAWGFPRYLRRNVF